MILQSFLLEILADFAVLLNLFSLQLSGSESLLDNWILSRLASAVEACESGMANYNFQLATTAVFNFWLYDLCDIYLEGSKPVLSQGSYYCLCIHLAGFLVCGSLTAVIRSDFCDPFSTLYCACHGLNS